MLKIHSLAAQGDCRGVRGELESGVPVDVRDDQDFTPLARAARSVDAGEEMLRLLIEAGADVNAPVKDAKTCALGLAACSGSLDKTQLLLDAGADIGFESPKGYCVVLNVVYALLDDEILVPMIVLLVRHGAEMNLESEYGESPLSVASNFGRFDAVRCLLDAGTDPSPLEWTELHKAVALGTCDEVDDWLGKGERLDARDRWERTPWLLANLIGDTEKAKLIHAAGANLDDRGRGGDSALMYCAARGHTGTLQWLIDIGMDLEAVDDSRYTALMKAAEAGMADCVQLLLQAGADPGRKNEFDDSAIMLASNEPTIRRLVNAGEDIGEISTEMRRMLTGLQGGESLNVSEAEYLAGRRPRFGRSNPEVMDVPFWKEMVRTGIAAYTAKDQFGDADVRSEAAWCYSRFGTSFTELPDDRFVQIGGEHEDFYDPDFYIYNDVLVHERPGEFQILGYPRDVFPPTDFHTATYFDGSLYIIGGLGYHGTRMFGCTPIYRLNCSNWQIELVESEGDNPGWIYKHRARLVEPGVIVVSGGLICAEIDGEEDHVENEQSFRLELSTMIWSRM